MPSLNSSTSIIGFNKQSIGANIQITQGQFISFTNNNGKRFYIPNDEIIKAIQRLFDKNEQIIDAITQHESHTGHDPWNYTEKSYRSLKDQFFPSSEFPSINPQLESQSKGIFNTINTYAAYILHEPEPEANRFGFSRDRLKNALNANNQKTRTLQQLPLGPHNTSRIALEALLYCYNSSSESFYRRIITTQDTAKIPALRAYAWVSKSALTSGRYDSRVFQEKPFIFDGLEYYLSNQWTEKKSHGRSIEDLNLFLKDFSVEIINKKGNDSFYLVRTGRITEAIQERLPKPFLLLAGISGTGKTRFVQHQAEASAVTFNLPAGHNYSLVPVRPDWHEPSDLLGYISRISNDGPRYVVTDLLRFIVSAWKHAAATAGADAILLNAPEEISPFWLCLDEMNLAPVEQYFADYLSILETRQWNKNLYSCEPLLKSADILQLGPEGKNDLWLQLGLHDDNPLHNGLKEYFSAEGRGIPIPPNLIVAGTVNMDESTHGFSRKVIDRALTIDFGIFFPNEYSRYYQADNNIINKTLNFPHLATIREEQELNHVAADPDGRKTMAFLEEINSTLSGTPFELAYRALNEALLFLNSFNPQTDTELLAVWDDFLMMKVLPRIEGDADRLSDDGETSLLKSLQNKVKELFNQLSTAGTRPDLLRMEIDKTTIDNIPLRTTAKLEWMQNRLSSNAFTSFWP